MDRGAHGYHDQVVRYRARMGSQLNLGVRPLRRSSLLELPQIENAQEYLSIFSDWNLNDALIRDVRLVPTDSWPVDLEVDFYPEGAWARTEVPRPQPNTYRLTIRFVGVSELELRGLMLPAWAGELSITEIAAPAHGQGRLRAEHLAIAGMAFSLTCERAVVAAFAPESPPVA
jgi:hypothetical protein